MRFWVLAAIPLALVALFAGEYAAAPQPGSTRALLASLSRDLRFAYHACVPLGWAAVPVRGTYYPGYTASAQNYELWLDALWRGRVKKRDLSGSQAREVFAVLNHLAAAGLLDRKDDGSGFSYFLTPRAIPYYYGSSSYGDNRDSLTYLCYSAIAPQRVDWMMPSAARSRHERNARWYTVQFSWSPSTPARWAADPFLRAHSVVLPPLTSPTTARVVYRDGDWHVANIYDRGWMLPALRPTKATAAE